MAGQGKQTSAERRRERAAAQRAAALAAARKRRLRMIGGFVAIVLLGGAVTGAVLGIKSMLDDDDTDVATQESATPTATPTPAPAGKTNCEYIDDGTTPSKDVGSPPAVADATGKYRATLTINKKPVVWELDASKAPCAVNSFVYLAKAGFFDDTTCHRMLDSKKTDVALEAHVIQCGDPDATGRGGPGYRFAEENLEGATYEKGVVAMAKASTPASSGSQFFMMFGESGFPPEYTPFARIVSGIEVLVDAAKGGTGGASGDEPKTKITISKVVIAEEGAGKGKATGKASAKPSVSSTPKPTSSPESTS